MTTPEEAVRGTREAVMDTMQNGFGPDSDWPLGSAEWERSMKYVTESNSAELDAYRDALLTAERARLAARVEGMRVKLTDRLVGQLPSEWRAVNEDAVTHNDALTAVLALLREPA